MPLPRIAAALSFFRALKTLEDAIAMGSAVTQNVHSPVPPVKSAEAAGAAANVDLYSDLRNNSRSSSCCWWQNDWGCVRCALHFRGPGRPPRRGLQLGWTDCFEGETPVGPLLVGLRQREPSRS